MVPVASLGIKEAFWQSFLKLVWVSAMVTKARQRISPLLILI